MQTVVEMNLGEILYVVNFENCVSKVLFNKNLKL
jgi:hypothetical protein